MSTTGKFCLIVTLLLLLMAFLPVPGQWGGWSPKLLVIHNEWAQKIRDAKEDVREKQAAEIEAHLEYTKASSALEAHAIGWDQVWRVQPNQIRNQNGQLILSNLPPNVAADLAKSGTFDDDAGNTTTVRPVIHAFYDGGESTTYVGEFLVADVGPNNAVLRPVHNPIHAGELQARASWNMQVPWRLRSIIPAALRSRVDHLHAKKVRTFNLINQTIANTTTQTTLLQEAQQALDVRKGELLGDDQRDPLPGRPEFKEGLLKVTEEVEEQRDQLLLDVDTLRRSIQQEGDDRDTKVETLGTAVQSLPGAGTKYDSLARPKVASGNQ